MKWLLTKILNFSKLRLFVTLIFITNMRVACADDGIQLQNLTQSSETLKLFEITAILTLLSLLPTLVVMATSFTRFVISLSFLRMALGLQGTPANLVLIVLALFMTGAVMGKSFDIAWREGVNPLLQGKILNEDALTKIVKPFKEFMIENTREKDLKLFNDVAAREDTSIDASNDLRFLVPAFMISELRRSFEIGFLIALPFLIIDIVVSTIIMSVGMMMMPPSIISLPIKILFFVMIDGWNLLIGSLMRSYF